eukprot:GEMP01067402.1.p1 GENE.GEMP01067402.1~~GEMP01067402.1.p1  ORF type:complete len:137 (+),score=39.63 GEMP01067402.1:59-469(+)
MGKRKAKEVDEHSSDDEKNKSRSRSREKNEKKRKKEQKEKEVKEKEKERDKKDELRRRLAEAYDSEDEQARVPRRTPEENPVDEVLMSKIMGFASFDTSKGKDHSDTSLDGVKKTTRRQYRQYMNRRGGFNRPLDS